MKPARQPATVELHASSDGVIEIWRDGELLSQIEASGAGLRLVLGDANPADIARAVARPSPVARALNSLTPNTAENRASARDHIVEVSWVVEVGDEFEPEFDALHEDVKTEILALARVLQQFGPRLGRPRVDTLNGSSPPT